MCVLESVLQCFSARVFWFYGKGIWPSPITNAFWAYFPGIAEIIQEYVNEIRAKRISNWTENHFMCVISTQTSKQKKKKLHLNLFKI